MIEFDQVTKRYPDTSRAAVEELSFDIPDGLTVALIGPSGCGKTTTLRMINRLVDPSSGTVRVDGRDVKSADPVALRRHIGYVIQQVGLFPHMTVAQNIAAVPKLLKWEPARIRRRSEELLDLVGLDASQVLDRYPEQLSGGQRQRIGVARALAADPPILLMDEPFGALDPVARGLLQGEFCQILKWVKKTVVLVTHDLAEAIRLSDRLAIMRSGRLVQYDSPHAVLAHPADDFVEDFVGPDRALLRLGLFRVVDSMSQQMPANDVATIGADSNLREALSSMLTHNSSVLAVRDARGVVIGSIARNDILAK